MGLGGDADDAVDLGDEGIEFGHGLIDRRTLSIREMRCLSGDSCKTTILDAIDLCLGARRNLTLNDADFHSLDVTTPIKISITVGGLNDSLKNSPIVRALSARLRPENRHPAR